jgi:hypothetical protein
LISMGSMLNKDSFSSKSFVISSRHHEMLKLGGTPCIFLVGNHDVFQPHQWSKHWRTLRFSHLLDFHRCCLTESLLSLNHSERTFLNVGQDSIPNVISGIKSIRRVSCKSLQPISRSQIPISMAAFDWFPGICYFSLRKVDLRPDRSRCFRTVSLLCRNRPKCPSWISLWIQCQMSKYVNFLMWPLNFSIHLGSRLKSWWSLHHHDGHQKTWRTNSFYHQSLIRQRVTDAVNNYLNILRPRGEISLISPSQLSCGSTHRLCSMKVRGWNCARGRGRGGRWRRKVKMVNKRKNRESKEWWRRKVKRANKKRGGE